SIVVGGLGKGTGSGAGPELLKITKELGVTTLCVVTMPASIEGNKTYENATKSYEKYKRNGTSVCVVDNEKIYGNNSELTLNQGFAKSNHEVANIVGDIINIVSCGSKINIDIADLKRFLSENKLLTHLTIDLTNEEYRDKKLAAKLEKAIIDASLKSCFSSKEVNVMLNISINNETPTAIFNDISTALKEITKNPKINIVFGSDTISGNSNSISLFISNEEEDANIKLLKKSPEQDPTYIDPFADDEELQSSGVKQNLFDLGKD
ncbi:MAG: hypothetical protein LBC33_02055, partial [Mycoplasmataceae bacterium]|nr:hypothetical protein [Mycoplasmataceae bacterium]